MTALAIALSTVLGIGYIPVAPGTFGSAAGLLLWWALPHDTATAFATVAIVMIAGTWSATLAERHFNSTDPGYVVIDEVLGMLITLLFNPVGWGGALVGFLLFRAADIVKPFPARRLEALHGGLGIMADDAAAAVYSNIALHLCLVLARTVGWTS
jgi:phosphatidylglycerophosphatase A